MHLPVLTQHNNYTDFWSTSGNRSLTTNPLQNDSALSYVCLLRLGPGTSNVIAPRAASPPLSLCLEPWILGRLLTAQLLDLLLCPVTNCCHPAGCCHATLQASNAVHLACRVLLLCKGVAAGFTSIFLSDRCLPCPRRGCCSAWQHAGESLDSLGLSNVLLSEGEMGF